MIKRNHSIYRSIITSNFYINLAKCYNEFKSEVIPHSIHPSFIIQQQLLKRFIAKLNLSKSVRASKPEKKVIIVHEMCRIEEEKNQIKSNSPKMCFFFPLGNYRKYLHSITSGFRCTKIHFSNFLPYSCCEVISRYYYETIPHCAWLI